MLQAIQTLIDGGLFNVDSVIDDMLATGDKGVVLYAFLRKEGEDFAPEDIEEDGDGRFTVGRREYLVLTDAEADRAVGVCIEESLWAFNANFLAYETDLPEEVFTALQDKCEGANDTFRKLIDATCGVDRIVNQAVAADGRGCFLSQYDGDEGEIFTKRGWFFIYRNN